MFADLIKQVQEDKRLVPDLMKADNGNNFRAISESAILDVINPILVKNGWFYEVRVRKSDLQIREAYGSKGKKLQFIATVEISIVFHNDADPQLIVGTESVGMGIDDNDKAMGKAYTYAIKYALLKLFRLRYGDDPDYEASKPLYMQAPTKEDVEKVVEVKMQPEGTGKKVAREKKSHKEAPTKEVPMSEAQRDYILGMMKKYNVKESEIISKFGFEPSKDEFIPMKTARAIIKWLEDGGYLPF